MNPVKRIHKPFIVDVRCRMATGKDADYFRKKLGENAPRSVIEGSEEAFFCELDAAGVRTAIAPSGSNLGMTLGHRNLPPRTTSNDEQALLQERHPGRYVGVAAIDVSNTAHDALSELKRCADVLSLRAATIEPGREPLNAPNSADPRLYEFYELAARLGMPVILQTSGLLGGKNIDYANPKWVDQVAEDFPDLTIICGHGCYPFVREAIAVAVRRKNVFLSPDLYLFWPGTEDWVKAVNQGWLVENFIFGSGYPLVGNLTSFVQQFLALGWHEDCLPYILYKNALRALKLETKPDFASVYQSNPSFVKSGLVSSGARKVAALMRRAGLSPR